MKRHNIESVLGFLDAVRRRDREAATACLHREIVWQGIAPELVCRTPDDVLDVFFDRRDRDIDIDRLELVGTESGAVFAFHRPGTWELAGIEVRGAIYHAAAIEDGRIMRIEDHLDRDEALKAVGA